MSLIERRNQQQKELADFDDDEIDALLSQLSQSELEELSNYVDPDDSCLPPSERCRYHTEKEPTGPYNRQKLVQYLEDQSKSEKDWEEPVPFEPKKRGKAYQPRQVVAEDGEEQEDDGMSTEWDDVLAGASEAEMVELAAILGFTGLINQVQYHASVSNKQIDFGGWTAAAKPDQLRILPPEPDNDTDVEKSIQQLKRNDASLQTLNLNNIKNISKEKLQDLLGALHKNTNLRQLSMANVEFPDSLGEELCEMLSANSTLKSLNLESNLLSGATITKICQSIVENKTLLELRLANQRRQVLGHRAEMAISEAVAANRTILRLGLHLAFPSTRNRVNERLRSNWDLLRRIRRGEEITEDEAPPPPPTSYKGYKYDEKSDRGSEKNRSAEDD